MTVKVHITGVKGLVGDLIFRHLAGRGGRYHVQGSDRHTIPSGRTDPAAMAAIPAADFRALDLADAAGLRAAFAGTDVVVHAAAVPDPQADFDTVLAANIVGTHNVLAACVQQGVRRLVYASTIMVDFGYYQFVDPYKAIREGRMDAVTLPIQPIGHLDPTWPTEPYSASKVWAEGTCRTFVDSHAMAINCIRIGAVGRESARSAGNRRRRNPGSIPFGAATGI